MKVEIKLKRLAIAAQKFRSKTSGGRLRWPEDFQKKTTALIKNGIGVSELSRATGIAICTLSQWRDQSTAKSNGKGFRKLKVIDRPKSVRQTKGPVNIFVTTSQGSEIHGLTSDEVAALVKRGVL